MTDSTNPPTLVDVLDRLDRLEAALHKLIEVASRAPQAAAAPAPSYQASYQPQVQQAPAYAPPRQTQPVPAPAPTHQEPGVAAYAAGAESAYRRADAEASSMRVEPPVIEVAPPNAPQSAPAYQSHGLSLEPRRDYDPYGFRTDIEVPPPTATIQQVLAAVFDAGLRADPEDTWAIMTKLTHASQMVGPRALDHFKAFAWHKLRRTTPTYLRNNDPTTFSIAYTDPAQPTPEVDRVRVFVKAGDNRMPVPVAFARDASQQNAWRLTMISL